jgi:hypothetical protein
VDSNHNWIYGWGTTLKDPSGSDAWFVRFDSMGCLTPGCDSIDTGIPLPLTRKEVPIYPNPVENVLYVDLRKLATSRNLQFVLFNNAGQEVWRTTFTSNGIDEIDLQQLSPGMYNAVIYKEGNVVGSEKLLKK